MDTPEIGDDGQLVTGEPFDEYTNWADGEPNDFDDREEDCLHPHPNQTPKWNDSKCDDRRVGGYVVEYDKPSKQVIERPLLDPANGTSMKRLLLLRVSTGSMQKWLQSRELSWVSQDISSR